MNLNLDRKVAVVTGASRGIGRAIALSLAAEGSRVLLVARGAEDLRSTQQDIEEAGGSAQSLALDVTDSEAPQKITEAAIRAHGPIDILISNVGINRRGALLDQTDEDWDAVFEANLRSHARLARKVGRTMKERRQGVMIFIASIFGREAGGPNLTLYNSSKAGLISLAKILALELASEEVRVNSVAPGSIRFPGGSWDRRCQEEPEAMARFVAENLPLGRFGKAEEVADVVTFLASERASLVTGACWTIDGGQSNSLI